MISHDVLEKQKEHDDLATKMAEWESRNGPVVCEPAYVRDDGGRMIIANQEVLDAARKRGGVAGSRHKQIK